MTQHTVRVPIIRNHSLQSSLVLYQILVIEYNATAVYFEDSLPINSIDKHSITKIIYLWKFLEFVSSGKELLDSSLR